MDDGPGEAGALVGAPRPPHPGPPDAAALPVPVPVRSVSLTAEQ
ncbi:hypothetical protein [Quadrisphaera granulorum]|nr:hypothetical protein [Quadrisphaera granulorum]